MARYQRSEQPKPIGTIVGVVIALGAMLVFMILFATGVIRPKSRQTPAPAPAGRTPGASVAASPGAAVGPEPAAPAASAPGIGAVRFIGTCDGKGNSRKVETCCPYPGCGKPVDSGIPTCPYCTKPIKWPEKVPCGFCSGKPGSCGVCQGTGNCPFCSKGPRMLMGVRPPCDACKQSGRCPGCEGSGKCGYCEEGVYYPGRTPPAKPVKRPEAPPPAATPEAPAAPAAPATPATPAAPPATGAAAEPAPAAP